MLLQERDGAWRGALGGPQLQHGVDRGDVEAFVEQVDGEEDLQVAGVEGAVVWTKRLGIALAWWT
jgi:hypothetical protein